MDKCCISFAVFHTITESAQAQEKSDNPSAEAEGEFEAKNDDKQREQEAKKKIAKANTPKKNVNKNPVQQIASIPEPKKEKGKDQEIGGRSSVSSVRGLSGSTIPSKPMRR